MDLKNVEYVFTITGGGWTTQHDLYAITKDRKVLHTEKFDDLEAASPSICLIWKKTWILKSMAIM